jgi:hypothetical protein
LIIAFARKILSPKNAGGEPSNISPSRVLLVNGEAVVRVAMDSPDLLLGGFDEGGVYSEEEHLGDSHLLRCHS